MPENNAPEFIVFIIIQDDGPTRYHLVPRAHVDQISTDKWPGASLRHYFERHPESAKDGWQDCYQEANSHSGTIVDVRATLTF